MFAMRDMQSGAGASHPDADGPAGSGGPGADGTVNAPDPPWRSAPRRGRSAPRPQLSRDVIVAAALKVVGSEGGEALTMRRVADEIGVSASALYGYIANKEELVQLLLEQIMDEVTFPVGAGDWQDVLRQWGRDTLDAFKRHPGVAALSLGRAPLGPKMLPGLELMLATLRSAGLPDQVAAFVGDIGALYIGAIAHEQDVTPLSDEESYKSQFSAWLKALPAGQFPNIVATADKIVAGTAEDRFEWGLDVIIRGLASYVAKPPGPEGHWPQA